MKEVTDYITDFKKIWDYGIILSIISLGRTI
jgi:hypothetical protein